MPGNIDKYYNLVLKLVNEGGKLIKQRVWGPKTIKTKSSDIDLVTETDQEIEKLLISGIGKEFPEHRFIGEETTASGVKPELTTAPTWIIDPVDGTMNFVHGYPCVCISIALLINKISEIGIIYNPVVETLFTARRGKGAFLNGNKIKTSSNTDLEKSLIIIEGGGSKNKDKENVFDENIKILRPKVHAIRTSGSAAWNMAMVGLGGADAFFEYGLHIWDMAAGDIIIREAGGTVVDPTGKELDLMSCRMLCAGTDQLAKKLSGIIKQYYPPRDA